MLEVIIVFAIYAWLQKIVIDKPIEKKIKESSCIEETISLRMKLKQRRKVFLILYISMFVVFSVVIDIVLVGGVANASDLIRCILRTLGLGGLIMIRYFVTNKGYRKLSGNISTFTKDQFLESTPEFALFLRGFEDDNYSKEKDLAETNDIDTFSEYKFINLLETRIPTCAIGMTKEVDSPYGAKRVYVDDSSWQSDVVELMAKTEKIYILVNDRDSCIWEIEQTANIQNKTIYIVNDIEKYNGVRKVLENKVDLPIIPSDLYEQGKHFFVTKENGIKRIDVFENNREGYAKILDLDIESILNKEKELEKRNRNEGCRLSVVWIFAIFVLLFIVLCISQAVVKCSSKGEEVESYSNELEADVDFFNGLKQARLIGWFSERALFSKLNGLYNKSIVTEWIEYDGHTVTMNCSVAKGTINFDEIRVNDESFRSDILMGYGYVDSTSLVMLFLEDVVKEDADLCLVFNCEDQEPIKICFTAKELENNVLRAEVDVMTRLKALANNTKLVTPVVERGGLILTDVFLDTHYYTVVYDCDESKYDIDYMEENKTEKKERIIEDVHSDNHTIGISRDLLIEANYGLAIKYVSSSSGKTCTIYIEPEELQGNNESGFDEE